MEGDKRKSRRTSAAGERGSAAAGKRKGSEVKKKTRGTPKQTSVRASAGRASARKPGGKNAGVRGVGKTARKASPSRSRRKSSVRASVPEPSVERVREEARALEAHVSGRAEPEVKYALPDHYGKDRIVAMPRDPYWIHVYWEVTEETLSRALGSLGSGRQSARRILRVYVREGGAAGAERILFDVSLTPEARNWYLNVGGPGRTYRVDVGLLTADGKFICLAKSNVVTTPSDRMSDVLDEKWMSLASEYEEMYALSGGLTRGVSSPELHERLARELEVKLGSPLFSPGVRDVGGEKEVAKPFWLVVDADLVVYGATAQGSSLSINGEEWRLREDGTFSFRCHLPDGPKGIEISARSSDGDKGEQVKLTVNRVTRQTKI